MSKVVFLYRSSEFSLHTSVSSCAVCGVKGLQRHEIRKGLEWLEIRIDLFQCLQAFIRTARLLHFEVIKKLSLFSDANEKMGFVRQNSETFCERMNISFLNFALPQ